MTKQELDAIRQNAYRNKDTVVPGVMCGCYYCGRTFDADEVEDWVDQHHDTALCPYCCVDSVVAGLTDKQKLEEAYEHFFNTFE